MYLLIVSLLCLKIYTITGESYCETFSECGPCIGHASQICVWCPSENHEGPRCKSKSEVEKVPWCSEELVDPQLNFTTIRDVNFNSGNDGAKIVQFKPQLLRIKARPGLPVKIKMAYKPAKDYPLDIYYLMDFSHTMVDYATTLREQGLDIFNEMSKLTNNVRLGVGSFVDKAALPYADVNKDISYSFKNHLSLTEDIEEFQKVLAAKPNGANYDEPEGSLDALMQAMVCKEKVGWRDNARRIIVLSTDSTYHSVGDGKFVGAFRPHDMKCHVTKNEYTKGLKLDYPSVHQINVVATENNFMIIFAAEEKVKRHYENLEKIVKGSKYVPLKVDSKLVDIIKNEYLSLIRNIQLDHNIPSFMKLNLDQDCNKKGECDIQHKQSLELTGTFTITSCPPDQKHSRVVEIGPLLLNEKLKIQVEIDCQCDCEKPGQRENDSYKCGNEGTYQCGICKCNKNRAGNKCQCDVTDNQDNFDCKTYNSDLLCNGHGTCSCGKCESCDPGYFGTYCERDNNTCIGISCSSHGMCNEGLCNCSSDWSGKYCECPLKIDSCKTSYSDKVCSGNGQCKCGVCRCKTCSGKFCDDCEEMALENCKTFEDFAYCNLLESKTTCELKHNRVNTEVIIGNKTEVHSPKYYMAKYWCKKVLNDNKIFLFKYFYSYDKLHIIIQNELEMPPVVNFWITVGSIIGAILLIGILTVIAWIFFINLHDKREYEKFCKKTEAGYSESVNPLYQAPATQFQNPAYCG